MAEDSKNTTSARIFFWIGIVLTIIGVLSGVMVIGELSDGILGGSRAHGSTRANDAVGFYIGVAGQSFFAIILLIAGIAFIRNKPAKEKSQAGK